MRLASLWESYKKVIHTNCSSQVSRARDLPYWRDKLFANIITYLMPLSLLAFIPGIYMAAITQLTFLLVADVFAILTVLIAAFLPGLSIGIRKTMLIVALYAVSTALLFYLGTFGPGLMHLLGITMFTVLIFERPYAVATVVLNAVICIAIGLNLHTGWFTSPAMDTYNLDSWVAVSANLILLSLLIVILVPVLFNGLQQTIESQLELQQKLEEKSLELNASLRLLNQKNEELEDFVHIASHDLKEPLRTMRNFIELLEKRYAKVLDEKGNKFIRFIIDGAQRMTSLVDELLAYSRVSRLYTSFEHVDLNQLFEELNKTFAKDIDERNARIIHDDLPVVYAVPVSIRMVFQNIISNGLKYQKPGVAPVIKVTSEEDNVCWKIKFTDNGIGIEPEYHKEIFKIFKRLHDNETYSGSGVGLAICKKIIDQHGGRIWVESNSDEGTTFTITLNKNGNQD